MGWGGAGLEVGGGELEQVLKRGAEGSAAGDGGEVPVWDGLAAFTGGDVAGDKALLLVGAELDGGVSHG